MGLCAFWGRGLRGGITGSYHHFVSNLLLCPPATALWAAHGGSSVSASLTLSQWMDHVGSSQLHLEWTCSSFASLAQWQGLQGYPIQSCAEGTWETALVLCTSLSQSRLLSQCRRQRSLCSCHRSMLGGEISIILKSGGLEVLASPAALPGSAPWQVYSTFARLWAPCLPLLDNTFHEHRAWVSFL